MPSKRTYKVRVSKDFIVLAGAAFFFCLWAIKDGWYPSDKTLKKHPLSVEVSFETAGTVGQLYVGVGDAVGEGQLLAELQRTRMQLDLDTAKKEYTAAKNKHALMQEAARNAEKNGASDAGIAEIMDSGVRAKTAMDSALKKMKENNDKMDASKLTAPTKGEIMEVYAAHSRHIEAGATALVIDPKDHFFLFNKSLAIFCFFAFWIFLALHLFAT